MSMQDHESPVAAPPSAFISAWMDHISDGIFVADGEGRYLDVNRRGCELLGRTREALLLLRVRDVISSEDLRTRPVAYQQLSVGASMLSERRLMRGDGSSFVAELSVTRLAHDRWISIVRDITARREAADAAERAELSFRALLDVLPDAVVVHRNGLVVYANATAASTMGYASPREMIGTPVLDSVHPDDRAGVRARVAAMITTGTPVGVERERFLRRDGTTLIAEVVALPMRFDGQDSLLAVARDIGERERLQAQVMRSERLASVGLLAAGVAHEINNPLAYALLNLERVSELLRAPSIDVEAAREGLRVAVDGARRVQRIVRDLRAFARGAGDGVEPVEVATVMHGALELVTNELRFRARVVESLGGVSRVLANADRLTQVFVNLLLNAAHAFPEGGAEGNEVRITTREEGDMVLVSVRDTGVGIAPEHLPHIFDPFFSTRPPGVGTGLGLAICHAIVTSFGGRIDVESRLGAGSTFTVALPSTSRVSNPPGPSIAPRAAVTPDLRQRLLLVEDERNMRLVLSGLLSERYIVVAAATGREAQRLLEHDDQWHVILCDLLMPEVSGMDLGEWVERHRPALAERMVFMTGGAFTERAAALLDRCPSRWIEKPFELDALLTLLARVAPQ